MIQTIPDFFTDIEKQLKNNYWKVFFKSYISFFLVIFTIITLLLTYLYNSVTNSVGFNNSNLLKQFIYLYIFMCFVFSLFYTISVHRSNLLRSLKIDTAFQEINLYESYQYFVKQEYPKLSDKEVDIMVEQFYEENRLKELTKLTTITSDIKTKLASDEAKEITNKSYFLKNKMVKSNQLIYKYY